MKALSALRLPFLSPVTDLQEEGNGGKRSEEDDATMQETSSGTKRNRKNKKKPQKQLTEKQKKKLKDKEMKQLRARAKRAPVDPKQTWRVVVGLPRHVRKRDIITIPDITLRDLWFGDNILFAAIERAYPLASRLFEQGYYKLVSPQLRLYFPFGVPLDDKPLIEAVFVKLGSMSTFMRRKVLFYLVPEALPADVHPTDDENGDLPVPLLQPPEKPRPPISYDSKAQTMKGIATNFMDGRISLARLSEIASFANDLKRLKAQLYEGLPKKEQALHDYLLSYMPPPAPKVLCSFY